MTKSIGKTNKNKGSNAERYYVKFFKELGYKKCVTARLGSKLSDDSGIDIINVPFAVQVKAGKQRGLNYSKTLDEVKEKITQNFPKSNVEHQMPVIIIHKKDVPKGRRDRIESDELVIMTLQDFKKIIKEPEKFHIKYWT